MVWSCSKVIWFQGLLGACMFSPSWRWPWLEVYASVEQGCNGQTYLVGNNLCGVNGLSHAYLKVGTFGVLKCRAIPLGLGGSYSILGLLCNPTFGNGQSISLLHDNWHPLGPLVLKFGTKSIYDSGLPQDSLISSVLQGIQWAISITQTIELNEIRNSLPPITVSGSSNPIDNIVWTLSSNGKFTVSSLWDHLRLHSPKVPWSHVWFPAHIPKCSLINHLACYLLFCLVLNLPLAAVYVMVVKSMTISSLAAFSLP